MGQHYSNPRRADDPHALPDVETFYVSAREFTTALPDTWHAERLAEQEYAPTAADELQGWYWWTCSPGCLPDSEPNGPFATEALAVADAQSDAGDEDAAGDGDDDDDTDA